MVACGTPQHPVGSGQGKLPAIDQREIKAVAFSLENNRTLLHFVVVVCVCVAKESFVILKASNLSLAVVLDLLSLELSETVGCWAGFASFWIEVV